MKSTFIYEYSEFDDFRRIDEVSMNILRLEGRRFQSPTRHGSNRASGMSAGPVKREWRPSRLDLARAELQDASPSTSDIVPLDARAHKIGSDGVYVKYISHHLVSRPLM